MSPNFLTDIQQGNFKSLARCISMVENQTEGAFELLKSLPLSKTPVVGFTGPPGAGKSTIVNGLIDTLVGQQKKLAVLGIDPSSPFHSGAFLGDRIRMNQWAENPAVYIRSLSSRGALGGLHPRIFEIADLLKAGPFDYVFIETVGIGQSELDIASIADFTVVVLTSGSGDEIQALKSGVLEIADLFVVNKADYPGTPQFISHLQSALHYGTKSREIIEMIATEGKGVVELAEAIQKATTSLEKNETLNLSEKAFRLILADSIKKIDRKTLAEKIRQASRSADFNVYAFVEKYLSEHP